MNDHAPDLPGSSENADYAQLIIHVRYVHFALTIVALLLIGASQVPRATVWHRALDQIEAIEDIANESRTEKLLAKRLSMEGLDIAVAESGYVLTSAALSSRILQSLGNEFELQVKEPDVETPLTVIEFFLPEVTTNVVWRPDARAAGAIERRSRLTLTKVSGAQGLPQWPGLPATASRFEGQIGGREMRDIPFWDAGEPLYVYMRKWEMLRSAKAYSIENLEFRKANLNTVQSLERHRRAFESPTDLMLEVETSPTSYGLTLSPRSTSSVTKPNRTVTARQIESAVIVENAKPTRAILRLDTPIPMSSDSDGVPDHQFYVQIEVPLMVQNKDTNLQNLFLDEVKRPYAQGEFADTFADLARLTKDLEELSLPKLKSYVLENLRRQGNVVEVFQIKLPIEVVLFQGLAILLGMQVYLLSYLLRLRGCDLSICYMRGLPWIGLFPGILPKLIVVTTGSVIPGLAALILARLALGEASADDWWATFYMAAILVITGAVIAMAAILFHECSRNLGPRKPLQTQVSTSLAGTSTT
jgi:hypothetical protein